ncbi:molybdopterin-dependent oxidoreductase [Reyranella sp. CPCC 100927]|uniref:molybdopterin-dependent oxidoreductase n=1 Tax=Reyranella sp. CPCC 100927 TaxID=2599616 RepID=UPI0011B54E58|nr:molybdopterin-dependent oxidoreductase [Reyranella sp. CPCC 100927]TWS99662.1 molybdopterin-dependent oxidoreductase [Reyranella sp. CPCC 100927]
MIVGYAQTTGVRDIRCRLQALQGFITPEEHLFVLAHVSVPLIDQSAWRLRIDGLVERPLHLSFDDLIRRDSVAVTAFHKCAGTPTVDPEPTPDRTGNVMWRGVRLRDLVEEAGLLADATHIWATGADGGTFQGHPITAYQKDVPLAKALAPEVLVAWSMNDHALSTERGGPVRLVVPGFYGTNSVKWLTAITVADRRATGPFTTRWYNDQIATRDGLIARPVWAVAPDSAIIAPDHDTASPSDRPLDIKGWTWGAAEIVSVDVSHDDGKTWLAATVAKRVDFSWQAFSVTVPHLTSGDHRLLSRATDSTGQVQPLGSARNAAVAVSVTIT